MNFNNSVISVNQISTLLDFIEAHPNMADPVYARSKEGRIRLVKLWEECAILLNNVSPNCIQKSADHWRTYYNEFKSKTLKKVKIMKTTAAAGEISIGVKKKLLTPLQNRLCAIVGHFDALEDPLPGQLELTNNTSSQHETEENPLRSAMTERIQQIRTKTENLQAQVAATNRLAAAVEALTDLLQEPMRIVLQRQQQDAARMFDSSDSE